MKYKEPIEWLEDNITKITFHYWTGGYGARATTTFKCRGIPFAYMVGRDAEILVESNFMEASTLPRTDVNIRVKIVVRAVLENRGNLRRIQYMERLNAAD